MNRSLRVLAICGFMVMVTSWLASAADLSRGIILDVPQEKMEEQFGKIPASRLTPQDLAAMASYRHLFPGDLR